MRKNIVIMRICGNLPNFNIELTLQNSMAFPIVNYLKKTFKKYHKK